MLFEGGGEGKLWQSYPTVLGHQIWKTYFAKHRNFNYFNKLFMKH